MIEILVALAILGILIIPIGSMVSSIIDVNKRAQDNLKMAEIMNDVVERSRGYTNNIDSLNEYFRTKKEYSEYGINVDIEDEKKNDLNETSDRKTDINITIDDENLKINNIYDIPLTAEGLNEIKIKASYDNNNKFKYTICKDEKSISVLIENPVFVLWLDNNLCSKSYMDISLDGIYDNNNKLIENKFISLNYMYERDNINLFSKTQFAIINKRSNGGNGNTSQVIEDVFKLHIKIKSNKTGLEKEQWYYITKRM